jgi:transposase
VDRSLDRTMGIALGAVEGFNNKAKLTTRKSYGFRVFGVIQIALYHALGNLAYGGSARDFANG